MNQQSYRTRIFTVVLFLLIATGTVGSISMARTTLAAAPQDRFYLYLPLMQSNRATTPQPPQPPSGGSAANAAFWLPFTTADGGYVNTANPNIAIDRRGGMHVTYRIALGKDDGHWPAYYAYCAAACGEVNHWARTWLGDNVFETRLQLDSDGHPRVLLYVYLSSDGSTGALKEYQYAACENDCTQATNWTITPIEDAISYDASRDEHTFHYFALDPQGHPAFIYNDLADHNDHAGTFYAVCRQNPASACADVSNWAIVTLATEQLYWPELEFAPDGHPRFAANFISKDGQASRLLYAECASDCTSIQGAWLYNVAAYSRFSLRLTHAGQPRLILYTGNGSGDLENYQLYYVSCDNNCAEGSGWQFTNLHSQNSSPMNVDLALDAQDRPRFIYQQGDAGAGYAWCNASCEVANGQWQGQLVEDARLLQADDPLHPIIGCSEARWTSGHVPQLALDPAGNPRAVFDTKHQYGGVDTIYGGICPVDTDVIIARFLMMNQP